MKRTLLYFYLLLFVCFWPSVAYAEVITHNYQDMYGSALTVTNSNKTGTTAEMIYTCSGGSAAFDAYTMSPYPICIKLKDSGAKVATTRISDLDSLNVFYYSASPPTEFYVAISTDSVSWTNLDVTKTVGSTTYEYKLPSKGDYYVRFGRKSKDFYLYQVQYITKPCHCLRVVSE